MTLRFKLDYSWRCGCGRDHYIPLREALVEDDAIQDVPDVIDRLNAGRRCLIVHDEITRRIAGNEIKKLLDKSGYEAYEVVVTQANETNIDRVYSFPMNLDFAIAVGGGNVIDTTKLATYRRGIPFISFPTAPSHSGIVSATASIMEDGKKVSKLAHAPLAVIADTEIISNAPHRMMAAGCGDLVAALTSLKDWELGRDEKDEYYCEYSADLALSSASDVFEYSNEIKSLEGEGIRRLVEALINAGVSAIIASSSRPCSGSEHLFSHYIDSHAEGYRERPTMHGELCGLGTVLMARYHELHNPAWWDRKKDSEYQWNRIKENLDKMGAPTTLEQIGLREEIAVEALANAWKLRPERYTILHKYPPRPSVAISLLRETGAMD